MGPEEGCLAGAGRQHTNSGGREPRNQVEAVPGSAGPAAQREGAAQVEAAQERAEQAWEHGCAKLAGETKRLAYRKGSHVPMGREPWGSPPARTWYRALALLERDRGAWEEERQQLWEWLPAQTPAPRLREWGCGWAGVLLHQGNPEGLGGGGVCCDWGCTTPGGRAEAGTARVPAGMWVCSPVAARPAVHPLRS